MLAGHLRDLGAEAEDAGAGPDLDDARGGDESESDEQEQWQAGGTARGYGARGDVEGAGGRVGVEVGGAAHAVLEALLGCPSVHGQTAR